MAGDGDGEGGEDDGWTEEQEAAFQEEKQLAYEVNEQHTLDTTLTRQNWRFFAWNKITLGSANGVHRTRRSGAREIGHRHFLGEECPA